jgi:hypothetical protein
MEDTDARLWHPWLRINRCAARHAAHATECGGVAQVEAEFSIRLMLPSELVREIQQGGFITT